MRLNLRDRRLRDTAVLVGLAISAFNTGMELELIDVGAATGSTLLTISGAAVSAGLLALVLWGIWKSDPGGARAAR
jgi:hypothetical protein